MKKTFIILVSSFLANLAYANSAADTLTSLLLGMNTMQADFSQTVKDKSAKSLQHAEGRMALVRPGKFRWDVKKPIAQLIIANGSRLWIYDQDLQQVSIRSFHKAAGQTPALLLSDKNLTLGKDFTIAEEKSPQQIAGYRVFLLTPTDKEDAFETIKLTFVSKQIREMQLLDRLGHIITISFNHVKIGASLPESLFTFKPGSNVDIIDETKFKK